MLRNLARLFVTAAVAAGTIGVGSAYAASGPANQPDLTVTVTADPAVAVAGALVTWIVNVTNAGGAAAGPFDVSLPIGAIGSGAGWTCFSVGASRSGPGRAGCHTHGLAAGVSAPISIATTAPGSAGTVSLTATVDSGNAVAESNETNNVATGSYSVPVNGPYDFFATHSAFGLSPVLPTETVSYTTSVGNQGIFQGFTTVTITDALPVGFSFVSWTASTTLVSPAGLFTSASPGTVNCTPAGDPSTGVVVTCTGVPNSSGASTQSGQVTIVAQPAATTSPVDYTATDTVTVDSDNAFAESNETNNTASAPVRVSNMLPDLAVAIATETDPVAPGGVITQNVTISNAGLGLAPAAVATFGPFAGTFIGGGGNSATCGVLFTTRSGPAYGCTVTNLAAGASISFPIQMTASGLVGTTTTAVRVATSGAREIPAGPDNFAQASVSVSVPGPVDLTTTVTTGALVAIGQPVPVTVNIANSGIGLAGATTVELTLPTGFTFAPAVNDPCSASGSIVSCAVAPMAPLRGRSFLVNMLASPTAGTFAITTVVDPANAVPESNETNNTGTTPVTVSGAFADLTTSVTGPATATLNSKPNYTITVTNSGNATADAITLTISAPGFARVDSIGAPTGWTCAQGRVRGSSGPVSCTGGTLTVGAKATIQVTPSGAIARGATQITANADPVNAIQELSETNNTSSFTTTIN